MSERFRRRWHATHLSNRSAVEKSVLRNDGQPLAKRVETNVTKVDAVDRDLALTKLDDSEERLK